MYFLSAIDLGLKLYNHGDFILNNFTPTGFIK